MNAKPHLIALSAGLLSLCACATKREVPFRTSPEAPVTDKKARYDHSGYAHIPDTPTSFIYRLVLKVIPYTRDRAFWGNWSGSGCRGGLPIDPMDDIFRLHDIAYAESRSLRTMRWADVACVEALEKLDPGKMSPKARSFRNRSIKFFSNPAYAWVGKPVSSLLRTNEARACPFQSEADVRKLFGLNTTKVEHKVSPALSASREEIDVAAHPAKRSESNPRHQMAAQSRPKPKAGHRLAGR